MSTAQSTTPLSHMNSTIVRNLNRKAMRLALRAGMRIASSLAPRFAVKQALHRFTTPPRHPRPVAEQQLLASGQAYDIDGPRGAIRAWRFGAARPGEKAKSIGYPADKLRSKSWDEFAVPGAPHLDIIITVCDDAAGEVCPIWPGNPATAHWGYPDPSRVEGSEAEKRAAFDKVFIAIRHRIELLVNLPLDKLEHLALKQELKRIAGTAGT